LHFTQKTLYKIRNVISMTDTIIHWLKIEHRYREGFLRFLCPACGDMNTSVFVKKNLARCFLCDKNYNTIDLFMEVNKQSFPVSAERLYSILQYYQTKNLIGKRRRVFSKRLSREQMRNLSCLEERNNGQNLFSLGFLAQKIVSEKMHSSNFKK
jgi:DNA primase